MESLWFVECGGDIRVVLCQGLGHALCGFASGGSQSDVLFIEGETLWVQSVFKDFADDGGFSGAWAAGDDA